MAKCFSIALEIDNIGPHSDNNKIDFEDQVSSNQIAFYAANGTGKSFISRSFNLACPDKKDESSDDLLTLGRDFAKIFFRVEDKKLEIKLKRNEKSSIKDSTNFIFHVFNSDYVEENIKAKNFTPDGNIEGYILSKEKIDLKEEQEKKAEFDLKLKQIEEKIDNSIENAKKDLRESGVRTNTVEYKFLNKIDLESGLDDLFEKDVKSFDVVVKQLEKLADIPDDLDDIYYPSANVNIDLFDDVLRILKNSYPSSDWDQEFVNYVKQNFSFVEMGIALSENSSHCPFCKRSFDEEALKLIAQYKEFIEDKEGKLLKSLSEIKDNINKTRTNLENHHTRIRAIIADVNTFQEIFPSISDKRIKYKVLNSMELEAFSTIENAIIEKSKNLSSVIDIEYVIEIVKSMVREIIEIDKENLSVIKAINSTKNNTNNERLFLRRRLCEAQFLKYYEILKTDFENEKRLQSELININREISVKVNSMKGVSKRQKYYETLTNLLDHFFKGKYQLDEESFQFVFLDNNIGEKLSKILSDGEKNLIAFCLYIAETHLYIKYEVDYDRLFFIIDDPISSMDFNYVYMVAQTLRELKEIFEIRRYVRMWIFTHNLEFYSMLVSNSIVQHSFVIKPGVIYKIDHQLLMPYESHLMDILNVAQGKVPPNHTTPNSIRHVLETISRFEFSNNKSLKEYIKENETLRKNSCLYTICQDLSHGGIRRQPSFTEEIMIEACKTIETFISERYNGQIMAIEKHNRSI
ncbi:MAG: AAA family ATPase [Saccharofermentanales bacterium]|jgi:hypothetical protein